MIAGVIFDGQVRDDAMLFVFAGILARGVAAIERNTRVNRELFRESARAFESEESQEEWKCLECNQSNPNTTFTCQYCGYQLK